MLISIIFSFLALEAKTQNIGSFSRDKLVGSFSGPVVGSPLIGSSSSYLERRMDNFDSNAVNGGKAKLGISKAIQASCISSLVEKNETIYGNCRLTLDDIISLFNKNTSFLDKRQYYQLCTGNLCRILCLTLTRWMPKDTCRHEASSLE